MTDTGRTDSGDHYFTARPATPDERRPLDVTLAGRRVTVEVAPGIFSPGGLDKGTAILFDEVPDPPPSGRFLDVGCGWGPIALTLGLLSEHAEVLGVDVNERSVDLTNRNAAALGLGHVRAVTPDAVGDDTAYDLIWSNPPIRIGKAALHDLLRTWLPRLAPGGEAYLVVQKNLGSDSLQRWIESDLGMPCARFATNKGFRVLHVTHP
ncbi:class I SAM-dependent methyltransferase [Knoellia subterranea]|uniref:16S RNA G1207 methylase RsmC n=1 Tax=Knoellia subterranea KCTC 19937 TaxID=1385521 RepID=A0A0A0JNV8_9MICO|nr:methyltransferase [Knoellia subterranea]KGN39085.1 16S RNA G1207 methylase RsmC [Knoellia subterranea KCTC 19937]